MTAVIEPNTLLTDVVAQAEGWVVFCIPQHPQVNGLKKEEQDKVIKWHFCVMLISCSSYFHIENLLSLCGPINLQPTMNFSSINLFSLPVNQPTWTSWIHIIFYKVSCTYSFLSEMHSYWLNLTCPLSCTGKENEQFLSILLYATCSAIILYNFSFHFFLFYKKMWQVTS